MLKNAAYTKLTTCLLFALSSAACSSDDGRGDDGDGDTGSGGSGAGSSMSGGSTGTGGEGNGGSGGVTGGTDAGTGGDTIADPPIIVDPPTVEDKCASATDNCVWVTGHFGSEDVDFDCTQDALLIGGGWGCLDDYTNWNVTYLLSEGPFEFDIDPTDDLQATNFWLGDAERLTEQSLSFAGTHCEGSRENGVLTGTCYGAWGDNGDGTYESEVFASFRF